MCVGNIWCQDFTLNGEEEHARDVRLLDLQRFTTNECRMQSKASRLTTLDFGCA
jgi:hypothetical protein